MCHLILLWMTIAAAGAGMGEQTLQAPATPVDAADGAEVMRLNAEAQARAAAQSAAIRQSQEEHARAQAQFARDQAAFEEAKRRNDEERAVATSNAAAYQRDLASWKATVAAMKVRDEAPGKRVAKEDPPAPPVTRMACETEATTGSNIPTRVCRSVGTGGARP